MEQPNHPALLAKALLEIGAVRLQPRDPFTWASGLRSPVYCDNRLILSYPAQRRHAILGLEILTKDLMPLDLIVGVATAGIPHGALLADRMDLPFAYVRSKAKAHGKGNVIEGNVTAGQRAVVIEDLISTGGSSLQAVKSLQDVGVVVVAVLALFTYKLAEADRRFREAGIPYKTVTDFPTIVQHAYADRLINRSDVRLLNAWYKDPQGWSDQVATSSI